MMRSEARFRAISVFIFGLLIWGLAVWLGHPNPVQTQFSPEIEIELVEEAALINSGRFVPWLNENE